MMYIKRRVGFVDVKSLNYVRKRYIIETEKYSDDQPRDDRGRWTDGGGSDSGGQSGRSGDKNVVIKELDKPLVITDSQLGKKIGKHSGEWEIDPQKPEDREKFKTIIGDIVLNHDKPVKIGEWRGQSQDTLFFIKGEDVVVTRQDGKFVTILKGGTSNVRVKNAREF